MLAAFTAAIEYTQTLPPYGFTNKHIEAVRHRRVSRFDVDSTSLHNELTYILHFYGWDCLLSVIQKFIPSLFDTIMREVARQRAILSVWENIDTSYDTIRGTVPYATTSDVVAAASAERNIVLYQAFRIYICITMYAAVIVRPARQWSICKNESDVFCH